MVKVFIDSVLSRLLLLLRFRLWAEGLGGCWPGGWRALRGSPGSLVRAGPPWRKPLSLPPPAQPPGGTSRERRRMRPARTPEVLLADAISGESLLLTQDRPPQRLHLESRIHSCVISKDLLDSKLNQRRHSFHYEPSSLCCLDVRIRPTTYTNNNSPINIDAMQTQAHALRCVLPCCCGCPSSKKRIE